VAFRTANAKEATNSATGEKWTEEQKAAYSAQQDTAFANFMRHYRGKAAKARVSFLAKVLEFSEEPYEKSDTINGVTTRRMVSDVKVELTEPGCEGIRFVMAVTDNPNTIQNTGSALNHLYVAATHRRVPEFGRFSWDPEDIIGKEVFAVIQRGNPRTDGKRGGFYSELKDFEELLPEDPTPAAPSAKTAAAKNTASSTARKRQPDPETPVDDVDDVPF
jgi:hypothetical protein